MQIRWKPGGRAGRSSSPPRYVPEVTLLTSSQRWSLADMGEEILAHTYADLLLTSFPKEFKYMRKMHHRDRSFTLDQIKQTATIFFINELSRKSSGPSVAGRVAAMFSASNNVQCHRCKAYGHYQSNCPGVAKAQGPKRSERKGKGKGGDPSPKCCSYHKTNSHSDSACYKEKELKQLAAYFASCLLYTSPSPRDRTRSRMPSSA